MFKTLRSVWRCQDQNVVMKQGANVHSVSFINLVSRFVSFHSSLSVLMLISSFVDFSQTFSCPGSSSLVWGVETEPEGGMNQMKIWRRGRTSRSRCRKKSWWVAGPVCWVTKHKFQTFFLILAHRCACVSSGTNWKYNSRPSRVSWTFVPPVAFLVPAARWFMDGTVF